MILLKLCQLRSGRLRCKICGDIACTYSRKCRACHLGEKFIESTVSGLLKDFGPLLAQCPSAYPFGVPVSRFVEEVMKPRATTRASKRLVHFMTRASKDLEKLRK